MLRAYWMVVLLMVVTMACDEPMPTTPDAGEPDAGPLDTGMPGPMAPVPPVEPDFAACPPGWSSSVEELGCSPWDVDARTTCADDEAWFVGDGACARLGTECPADGFPASATAGAVFVRAGAETGGDGSRGAPFHTIRGALAVAAAGAVVAIGVGTYDELIDLPGGVTLLGACVGETILSSSELRSDRGVVTVMGAGAAIRNLAIGESEQPGVWVVGEGRSVDITDVAIRSVRIAGLDAERDAVLTASHVTIRDVRPHAAGRFGRGVTIESGADATLTTMVVEGCREVGVLAFGEGVEIDIEDVAILRTEALADGNAGVGLQTFRGGSITGQRVLIDEATDVGISVREGIIDLTDVVVRRVRSRPMALDHGRGVNVEEAGQFNCVRCVVEDTWETAIVAAGEGSSLRLEDLVVRRVASSEGSQRFGLGVSLQHGASVTGARWLIEDAKESAIVLGGSLPSSGLLEDITVRRTRPAEGTGIAGRALSVQSAATLDLRRARFEDSFEGGALVTGTDAVFFSDVVIDGVSPALTLSGIVVGRGLSVQYGADLTVERAEINNVWESGVVVFSPGTSLDMSDISVTRVRTLECSEGVFCGDARGGHSVGAYLGGTVTARAFSLGPADVCGVHVAEDGTAILSDGAVHGTAIGACVQSDRQSLDDLQDQVRYTDNGVPLQATTLPVPSIGDIAE